MKILLAIILGLFLTAQLSGQDYTVQELVLQGIELHDQGKYNEAISKYKAALMIDKNSTPANYELSYTYMTTGQYAEALTYCNKVIKQDANNQQEAYVVLGNSLDMLGKPQKAIKAYEEGLAKYPNSNLLNYNLALTSFNLKDYDKAEKGAINAIIAKPNHGSSHILLSEIMKAKRQRVKSLLSLYYFLMIEPNSNRSQSNYNSLRDQLGQGVEKKDEKNIEVSVPFSTNSENEFGTAEMMVCLLAASRYTEENIDKSDMELFTETTRSFLSILGESKKDNTGFWWDFYVLKLYNIVQTNNYEAFSYYISQSSNSPEVNNWITSNHDKMEILNSWMNKK